jgi:hypothetical protein
MGPGGDSCGAVAVRSGRGRSQALVAGGFSDFSTRIGHTTLCGDVLAAELGPKAGQIATKSHRNGAAPRELMRQRRSSVTDGRWSGTEVAMSLFWVESVFFRILA